jgi:hypothetical protein
MEVRSVFITDDGKQFNTKAEANEYLRRPKILEALRPLTEGNTELATWLLDNRDVVENAFDIGTIRRVTKVEQNKLAKSLKAIKEANDPKFAFVSEHADVILEVFRWPTVKRMTEEEKATAARNTLLGASDNNAELAEWVLSHKEQIQIAYGAGIEKKVVNQKAQEALAAYRAKRAAEKAAAEAAKAA